MKKILILFILFVFTLTNLNAGFIWNSTKAVAKTGIMYGVKRVDSKNKLTPTKHSVQQKINRNVKTKDELDALKRPLEIKPIKVDKQGRESQRFIGEKAEVAINPSLGKIVSVNPTSTKKSNKLKAQR